MKKPPARQFLRIPHSLLASEGVKGSTIATYAALASYADNKGFCYPSVASIAKRAGISIAIARRECSNLDALGYLEITPHMVESRQTSNRYLLKWQSGEVSNTQQDYQKDEGRAIENATPPTIENDGRTRIILNQSHLTTATELVSNLWSPTGKAQSRKAVISVINTALENGCSQSELSSALLRLNSKPDYITGYSLQRELTTEPSFRGKLAADKEVDWSKESTDL